MTGWCQQSCLSPDQNCSGLPSLFLAFGRLSNLIPGVWSQPDAPMRSTIIFFGLGGRAQSQKGGVVSKSFPLASVLICGTV